MKHLRCRLPLQSKTGLSFMYNQKKNIEMKKLLIIAILAISADIAMAQTQEKTVYIIDGQVATKTALDSEKTVYIIDGQVATKAALDSLPSDIIKNMNVIKKIENVVVVNTKRKKNKVVVVKGVKKTDVANSSNSAIGIQDILGDKRVKSFSIRNAEGSPEPLVIVKGTDGKTEVIDDMKKIQPQTIKSVTVIKNEDTKRDFSKWGDTSGGVIVIELK